ncbi:hypothetical protein RB601_006185 [Gaeumannomyces tritici]
MKAVSMIVGAFAALAIAAPTTSVVDTTPKELETRAFAFDLNAFNNFGFANQDLAYLGVLNQIPFQTLYGLAINNGLQLNAFQGLFAQQAQFDIVSLIQLAQLQALGQVAQLGVFNAFNLQQFNFAPLDLGLLLQSFNGFNLQQFVGAGIVPQIGAIAQQQVAFVPGAPFVVGKQ